MSLQDRSQHSMLSIKEVLWGLTLAVMGGWATFWFGLINEKDIDQRHMQEAAAHTAEIATTVQMNSVALNAWRVDFNQMAASVELHEHRDLDEVSQVAATLAELKGRLIGLDATQHALEARVDGFIQQNAAKGTMSVPK